MNSYLNLQATPRPLKLIDEPCGYVSAMAKANLGHQMRYSVELLEKQLADEGAPRILQLQTEGDERDPSYWKLYANGELVASGTGEFARECFERDAAAFLEVAREAVAQSSEALTRERFETLAMARSICRTEQTTTGKRQ